MDDDDDERTELLVDDGEREEPHRHYCPVCVPPHEWTHSDALCWIDTPVICDDALAIRKAKGTA